MANTSQSAKEMMKATLRSMPLWLAVKTSIGMMLAGKNKKKRLRLMKDIAARRHFTVPREEIPWHPTIDDQRCDRCGVCLSFCPKDVFEVDMATGAVQVVRPAACVFLCTGCVAQCASDAISFPDREPFRKYVYYR